MTREQAINYLFSSGFSEEQVDGIVKALEPRWILVSERLPASYEEVLVTNGARICVGWIDPTDRCWRVDSKSEYFIDEMVAWMPLPQAYREVEK